MALMRRNVRFENKQEAQWATYLTRALAASGLIGLGISTAAQYRQICEVGTLLPQP